MNGLGRGDNQEQKDKNSIISRETVGMTLLLFGAIVLLIALTRSLMFGDVGVAITAFLLGCFGYLTYPLLALVICISVQMVSGKRFLPKKWTGWFFAILCTVFFIVHLATSADFLGNGYGSYLADCFTSGEGGIATSTAGGLVYGLITYPVQAVLSQAGTYVAFSFAVAVVLFFFLRTTTLWNQVRKVRPVSVAEEEERGYESKPYPFTIDDLEPVHSAMPEQTPASAPALPQQQPTQAQPSVRASIIDRSMSFGDYRAGNRAFNPTSTVNQSRAAQTEEITPTDCTGTSYLDGYVRSVETTRPSMPRTVEHTPAQPSYQPSYVVRSERTAGTDYYSRDVVPQEAPASPAPTPTPEVAEEELPPVGEAISQETPAVEATPTQPTETPSFERQSPVEERRMPEPPVRRESASELFEQEEEELPPTRSEEILSRTRRVEESVVALPPPAPAPAPTPAPKPRVRKPYLHPSLGHFKEYDESLALTEEEIQHNSETILRTLQIFSVSAEIVGVICGTSITQYNISIAQGVKVAQVLKLSDDLSLALKAGQINMYPNNEQGTIAIEVPNRKRSTVGMRALMQEAEFQKDDPKALKFVIGRAIDGSPVFGDIAKMKHLLIAGTTGSGKSVTMHAMLTSLITKYTPDQLRLIMIDPKQVEFVIYGGIPHLMINEIITDPQKTVTALTWAVKEMERRYKLFADTVETTSQYVNDIETYNAKRPEGADPLPRIVIVVDEFADLMSVAQKDIEERIKRLTAKARAAGIHIVLSTQRPSVDVITGVIKSNLPSQIALSVSKDVDSRVIIDESGAEKLLGNGDLLLRTEGKPLKRVQGAYVSPDEVQELVRDIKKNNESYYDDSVSEYINKPQDTASSASASAGGGEDGQPSEEYIRSLAIVVKLKTASISLLQRKCGVGYNHAGRIMEWMETMGYVSPFDGSAKARTVLLTQEEFNQKYGGFEE